MSHLLKKEIDLEDMAHKEEVMDTDVEVMEVEVTEAEVMEVEAMVKIETVALQMVDTEIHLIKAETSREVVLVIQGQQMQQMTGQYLWET